jgi:transposase-like protein
MLTAHNRYARHAHLSETHFRRLLRLFALDLEATKVAALTGLNRNTVNRYFQLLRVRIAAHCERAAPLGGTVEVDESYFGPHRVRGKAGRGAGKKTIVFGILKRNGQVYTEIIPNVKKATIQAIIRGHVTPAAIVCSDGYHAYNGLAKLGFTKHYRVPHRGWVLVGRRRGVHINGIESFWAAAKTRLARRRGMRADRFYWHLKECEFRFNHRSENLYRTLLKIVRKDPLN